MTERDQEEQDWRIEQMIEGVVEKRLNGLKLMAEADKLRRDRTLAPWQLVLAGATVGGAIFAGGAAFLGLILHWIGRV